LDSHILFLIILKAIWHRDSSVVFSLNREKRCLLIWEVCSCSGWNCKCHVSACIICLHWG